MAGAKTICSGAGNGSGKRLILNGGSDLKRIICYGDSNTYGYDTDTNGRFSESIRYPGALQKLAGAEYTIIEEGLSGRTTCFNDPLNEGLNGLDYLYPCLMSHGPFDTLIIMLGTNDCKERFSATPKNIADGMKRIIEKAKLLPVWTNKPHILLVCPPPIQKGCESSPVAGEMGRCSEKSYHLSEEYKALAELEGIDYLDAGDADINQIDYMHLSAEGHRWLAHQIWNYLLQGNL